MKILFDQNVPLYLSALLVEHEISTAYREGWGDLQNGKLLDAAEESGFKAFVTLDKNISFQQKVSHRKLAIMVLSPRDQSRQSMTKTGQKLVAILNQTEAGRLTVISEDDGGL